MVEKLSERPSVSGGRYELLEVIGAGGMAVVWRAYDHQLTRPVACKVLTGPSAHDLTFQERFQREARHSASLSHPNIVKVFDFGLEGATSFIVMEFVPGASLLQLLTAGSTLSVAATAAVAVDVLAALTYTHERGVVHRDIKPGNLLLELDGNVKVADFGIAKSSGEATDLTIGGSFVGTAAYASPEQLSGLAVGPATDVYSLGCVLFQCLAGRPPFVGDDAERLVLQQRFADPAPLASFRGDVPDEMAQAIQRALSKVPTDRSLDTTEMMRIFAPFADAGDLRDSQPTARARGADANATEQGLVAAPLHPAIQVAQPIIAAPPAAAISPPRPVPAALRPEPRGRHVAASSEGATHRSARWIVLAAIAAVAIGVAAYLLIPGTNKPPGKRPSSVIASGAILASGHALHSPNGRFELIMQTDGNLVDYQVHGAVPQWQSGTTGNDGAYAVMQTDGNLVVYPKNSATTGPGQPTGALWDSATYGYTGATASLTNTGVLTVRSSEVKTPLWASPLTTSS